MKRYYKLEKDHSQTIFSLEKSKDDTYFVDVQLLRGRWEFYGLAYNLDEKEFYIIGPFREKINIRWEELQEIENPLHID